MVTDFIVGAKKSLLVAVQELDSRPVAEAILAAKTRKVRIRVILEGDYLLQDPPLVDPWSLTGGNENNRVIHAALLRAGVDVITDLNPKIFHQKFIVRDPGRPAAAVLSGSTNLTLTDTGMNPPGTRCRPATTSTTSWSCTASGPRRSSRRSSSGCVRAPSASCTNGRKPRPAEFGSGGIRVKPLFAPRHGPEMEIMKQMLKARSSIDFAMFTFAQSSGIDDTMARLVTLVPRIRGVLDRGQGAQKWAATEPLKAAGVQLFKNKRGGGVRKVHHKLMVIDERLVIAGSFNYTAPATTLNDENIIVLGRPRGNRPCRRGSSTPVGDLRAGRNRPHHQGSERTGVKGTEPAAPSDGQADTPCAPAERGPRPS